MNPLTCAECDATPAYFNDNQRAPLCRDCWTDLETIMARRDQPGVALPWPGDETLTPEPELISLAEAAARFHVRQRALNALVNKGFLPAVTVPGGKKRRVRPDDVMKALAPCPVTEPQKPALTFRQQIIQKNPELRRQPRRILQRPVAMTVH